MNQNQRDFLIKHVEKTYRNQREKLDESKPSAPSLNNYLIAAILEGSFELQPAERLRETIHQQVLELGADGKLIVDKDRWNRDDDEEDRHVTLCAEDVFVLPHNYQEAREQYERERAKWAAQARQLEEYRDTIILKIQIGSAQVLAKLIEQVDNLADLNIVNTNLLLTAPDTKRLKE